MLYSVADIWVQCHLPGRHNQKEHAGGYIRQEKEEVRRVNEELERSYKSWASSLTDSEKVLAR